MSSGALAKITKPALSGIIPRKRLFRMLDDTREKRIAWISAPAGSGKTTLVASYLDARKLPCVWFQVDSGDADLATFFYYMGLAAKQAAPRYRKSLPLLTPEYFLGIPVFARRFFEELGKRLKQPCVIVFDDYHSVLNDLPFHEVFSAGISSLPSHIRVIVQSRSEPPQALMRMRANNDMSMLVWDDLRFTIEETKQVLTAKQDNKPSDNTVAAIHEKTDGWAAGLVLLTGGGGIEIPGEGDANRIATKEVFNYFAGEVLDNLDSETRDFLLMTSFLPRMTVNAAEIISDQKNAGPMLISLNRNHFFTEKHEENYQYHPLFREFLLGRMMESLNAEGILRMQQKAASVLEGEGQIEDAVSLYLDAKDWEKVIPLILSNAQSMTMQGRSKTLERWLSNVPLEITDATPWLLYWSGMCRMGHDPGARKKLEKAFELFSVKNDHLGKILSWSFIALAIHLEWNDFHGFDECIAIYFDQIENILPEMPHTVQASAMNAIGTALMIRKPDHPRTAEIIKRAIWLSNQADDLDKKIFTILNVSIYFHWTGDFAQCIDLLDKFVPTPLSRASDLNQVGSMLLYASRHLYDVSALEDADRRIAEAFKTSARTGIRYYDHALCLFGVYGALMRGDITTAADYMGKFEAALIPSRKEMYVQHHLVLCWYEFLRGNFRRALSHVEEGLKVSEETGYLFGKIVQLHAMAAVLFALKDSKADECLKKALDQAVLSRSIILEFQCRLTKAQFAIGNGNEKVTAGLLREALSLGKQHGYFQLLWWWDPAAMSRIAVKALEYGIETEYVHDLIRIRKLSPEEPPRHVENWPWPIKVRTLGGFGLEKDGVPATSFGKTQKPLALLKTLVALGGNYVRKDLLIDLLWPDAEGDAGQSAFTTNMARLRNLLGNDDAVLFQEGGASLNPRMCWVDVRAFEQSYEKAEQLWNNGRAQEDSQSLLLMEKSLGLYKGHFLPEEAGQWAIAMRERLRNKYFRLVTWIGGHYEKEKQWDRAVDCYQKALETDDLVEDVYQRLMICHHNLGRRAEALRIFERCAAVFHSSLHVEPSAQTLALKETILKN